ncbi:hypothetical protein GGX14DRAFT_696440 [Mycena pura]|uniref:Uncharacterized protein n=1 Tax=Mycena pura TaxID=153505 RepID=A0AAD6VQ07_9AGAR|nr:hypothetical protein GGX14DRAFT_696440 [Mycena pura]
MSSASASESHPAAAASATASSAEAVHANTQSAETQDQPPVEEHKKHGLGGFIEKLTHPLHHHEDKGKQSVDHAHAHDHEHAVPEKPSDGSGHLAPGGSALGGIM